MSFIEQIEQRKARKRKRNRKEEIRRYRQDGWACFFVKGPAGLFAQASYKGHLIYEWDTVTDWIDRIDAERLADCLTFAPRVNEPIEPLGWSLDDFQEYVTIGKVRKGGDAIEKCRS